MLQPPKPPAQKPIRPVHVLIICLGVAIALFAGSLIIGWAAWQANKNAGGVQTDLQN